MRFLTGSPARRRMSALAATGVFFSFFSAGVEVVLPLWATKTLGCSAAEWAHLRSVRMAGVLVCVIFLGALSDRFGQRRIGVLSMLGTAVVLVVMSYGGRASLWGLIPIFGALVSTIFLNMNTLIQYVSDRRQGLANSIYRSVGAGAGVAAPIVATGIAAAWGGYPAVFRLYSGLLLIAAAVLWLYPGETAPAGFGQLRAELRQMFQRYRETTRLRPLMRVIHLTNLWMGAVACVGAFSAIRFTRDLLLTDHEFGGLASVAGCLTFLLMLGGGLIVDRLPVRTLMGLTGAVCAVACVVMGASDSLYLSTAGFLVYCPFLNLAMVPMSMWVSRTAGSGSKASAFSVQKIVTAGYFAVFMALLGVLESWVSIRPILLMGGIVGLLLALILSRLPEPPRPEQVEVRLEPIVPRANPDR